MPTLDLENDQVETFSAVALRAGAGVNVDSGHAPSADLHDGAPPVHAGPAPRPSRAGGPSPHRHLGPIAAYLAAFLVALLVIGFVMGVSGHQVSNVFSNVSAGLAMGGGGPVTGASSDTTGSSAAQGSSDAAPAPSAPAASAAGGLDAGTIPAGSERTVHAAYTVAPGGFHTAMYAVVNDASALCIPVAGGDPQCGRLVSSTTYPDSDGTIARGTVVVAVPGIRLVDLVTHLPADFRESSVDFATTDHSGTQLDVSTKLGLARLELAAAQHALAANTDPGQIDSLVQNVESAQVTVNSLQTATAQLADQTSMSTATFDLTERGITPPPAQSKLSSALYSGWDNDVSMAAALVFLVLSGGPLLILAGGAAWLVRGLAGRALARLRRARA